MLVSGSVFIKVLTLTLLIPMQTNGNGVLHFS